MKKEKITSAEDMDTQQLDELIFDMIHRIVVHHTLWFRETEHQLGFEKALEAMDKAWEQTKAISLKRFAALGLPMEGDMPAGIANMDKEHKLALIDTLAKNWLAQDGVWFQAVEFAHGMNDAKRCNDSTWHRFSLLEAHSIKKLLGMGDQPGLNGLERALNFRMYGRLNVQSCHYDGDALIFEMNKCRVQYARQRKGLEDYPCKSAGLVEYSNFAEGIDDRIKTECIACPPDKHPEHWSCAWRFTIKSEK